LAKNHKLTIPAHYNIYTGNNPGRQLTIYFSEPDAGVNEETGLLLLISGFGGNSQSNVYKKMREQFTDQYNLVTIQCDYFGSEFMQNTKKAELNIDISEFKNIIAEEDYFKLKENITWEQFVQIFSKYPVKIPMLEILDENNENFNDMGFMQALDLLTALYAVKIILKDNKLSFNQNKVIAYGHSHGAYLGYLCNRLAPNDFTLLIDNSAWIKPVFLDVNRYLFNTIGEMTLQTEFSYLAKELNYDKDILYLPYLYKDFQNNSQIWSFHGKDDSLVSCKEKEQFCNEVGVTKFFIIDESKVDNKRFYSTGHGLGANFLELFKFVMENVKWTKKNTCYVNEKTVFRSSKIEYTVDFDYGLPVMSLRSLYN
jgi:hypothetical protein